MAESGDGASDRLLGWARVRDITGLSRTTAWRLQRTGDFPLPVQLSPGRVAWRESELEAWKAARSHRGETAHGLRPPRAPRLAGMPRARPAQARAPAPPGPAPVSDCGAAAEPAARVPVRRKRGGAPPGQLDFGF